MQDFANKVAVVTGGGTGMGRELCLQLVSAGCHVAMCDVSEENMATTKAMCEESAPAGTRVTTHRCDVSSEEDVNRFAAEVRDAHGDKLNLLFNNAGIGGGGSFVAGERDMWEKTFGVCWYGVYYCCRAFVDMVVPGWWVAFWYHCLLLLSPQRYSMTNRCTTSLLTRRT